MAQQGAPEGQARTRWGTSSPRPTSRHPAEQDGDKDRGRGVFDHCAGSGPEGPDLGPTAKVQGARGLGGRRGACGPLGRLLRINSRGSSRSGSRGTGAQGAPGWGALGVPQGGEPGPAGAAGEGAPFIMGKCKPRLTWLPLALSYIQLAEKMDHVSGPARWMEPSARGWKSPCPPGREARADPGVGGTRRSPPFDPPVSAGSRPSQVGAPGHTATGFGSGDLGRAAAAGNRQARLFPSRFPVHPPSPAAPILRGRGSPFPKSRDEMGSCLLLPRSDL